MGRKLLRYAMVLLVIVECSIGALYYFNVLVSSYGNTTYNHLKDLPCINLRFGVEENSTKAYNILLSEATRRNFVIYRADSILSSDGGNAGYRFGIFAPTEESLVRTKQLHFLGNDLYTTSDLEQLLRAESMKTLGIERSNRDTLKDIPYFPGQEKLVIYKLQDLKEFSGSVEGTYYLDISSLQDYQEILDSISRETGRDIAVLSTSASWQTSHNLYSELFFYALIFSSGMLVVLTIAYVTTLYRKLGTHLLLGWSPFDFATKELMPFIWISFLTIPMTFVLFFTFSQGFRITPELIIHLIAGSCPIIAVVSLAVACGVAVICKVRPVQAIKNQQKLSVMFVLMLLLYLIVNAVILSGFYAIDGPLRQYQHFKEVGKQWEQVQNYRILYKEAVGHDEETFSRRSTKHYEEFYRWYQSIEDKEGVYLANTSFFSKDILDSWAGNGTYSHVPLKPYWSFIANANYLDIIHFNVPEEAKYAAAKGIRVYFIPASYSREERNALEKHLQEVDASRTEGDIKTPFMMNPAFKFITYEPKEDLFTWAARENIPLTTNEPVIYLAHTNNMTWFEDESLSAKGLENSYVKLSEAAVERYATSEYLKQFNMDDNEQTWLKTSEYVDGIRKSIQTFLELFALMACVLVAIQFFLVIAIASIYATHNRERLAVRRIMGYGLLSIFLAPFMLITGTALVLVLLALYLKITSAALFIPLLCVVQLIILFVYAKAISQKQMSQLIKEG